MPSSSLYQLVNRDRFTLDVFRELITERATIIVDLFRSNTPPANLQHYGLFWQPDRAGLAVPFSNLQSVNWLSNIGPSESARELFNSLRGVVGPLDHSWLDWPSGPPRSPKRRYWMLANDGTWLILHVKINDSLWHTGSSETSATIKVDHLPIWEVITSFDDGRRVWRELGKVAQTFLDRAESRVAATRESVESMNDGADLVEMLIGRMR